MALTTHILPSERVTIQLCWLRWKDISWSRKAIWKHFLNSGHWKKLFGRSRGSDVLDRLKAQRPIICPLWWIRWSDVSRLRKALRNHSLHPGHRKHDFDEVA
jgi:hypothetical protein